MGYEDIPEIRYYFSGDMHIHPLYGRSKRLGSTSI
jgi:hypothetical protein